MYKISLNLKLKISFQHGYNSTGGSLKSFKEYVVRGCSGAIKVHEWESFEMFCFSDLKNSSVIKYFVYSPPPI